MNRSAVVVAAMVCLLAGTAWGQSRSNASRVDFDDQLVQGQVNRGAVHLIERKESDLGSLVKKRTSYRKEILAGTTVAEAKQAPRSIAVPVVTVSEQKVEAPVAPSPEAKAATVKKQPAARKPAAKQVSKSNGGSRVVTRR